MPLLYFFQPRGYIQNCFNLSKTSLLPPVGRSWQLGSTITSFLGDLKLCGWLYVPQKFSLYQPSTAKLPWSEEVFGLK